ncbi:MAG: methyltransferase domain-containing protein [Phycisphaerae bacterium]
MNRSGESTTSKNTGRRDRPTGRSALGGLRGRGRHDEGAMIRAFLRSLQLPPTARILDVGCGVGRWMELLASLGVNAVGVDINADRSARNKLCGSYGGIDRNIVKLNCL